MKEYPITIDETSVQVERTQLSHGRPIRVVSVFPKHGNADPEEKLKALIDMEFQVEKLCA